MNSFFVIEPNVTLSLIQRKGIRIVLPKQTIQRLSIAFVQVNDGSLLSVWCSNINIKAMLKFGQ